MARIGLYKSEVKKARDLLLAQGKKPSVDALRVALGNTGSKTTIHKYLKELAEEGASADGGKPSISETLQDLVARLAAQLQNEADLQHAAVLQAAEQRCHVLEMQLAEKDADTTAMKNQLAEATQQAAYLSKRMYGLQLKLASTQAKLEARQTMTAELHAYMDQQVHAGKGLKNVQDEQTGSYNYMSQDIFASSRNTDWSLTSTSFPFMSAGAFDD